MTTKQVNPRRRLAIGSAVAGLAIGSVLIAIELRQGATTERAFGGFVILLAYAAILVIFQSRSETAIVTSVALVAAFGIAEATGRENWQFAVMALILSGTYIAGIIWHRWRM